MVALVCNFIMACVLSWLVIQTGEQTAMRGIGLGALLWMGLVGTSIGTEYVFESRSLQIFAITGGYPLVGLVLMGAIVGGWKK